MIGKSVATLSDIYFLSQWRSESNIDYIKL